MEIDNIQIQRSEEPFEKLDFYYKVIVVGASGVGKTSFIRRAVFDKFDETYKVTLIADLSKSYYTVNASQVKVQFWDTCGLEQYRSINCSYYRGATIALLLYDITDFKTLSDCTMILNDIREFCTADTLIYLVGTKSDLEDEETIVNEGKEFVQQNKLNKFFKVSSKTGSGIEDLIKTMLKERVLSEVTIDQSIRKGSFDINTKKSKQKNNCSC